MGYSVKCETCGEKFNVSPSRYKKQDNFCCSRQCRGIYKKANNPNYIDCFICGKTIYRKPHRQEKSKHPPCCSYECMGELRKMIYQGENNPNYGNTGLENPISKYKTTNVDGYILIKVPEHPFSFDAGWIREHRLVAEKHLLKDKFAIEINNEKYLAQKFDVHHKNLNKQDNRPENLKIITRSQHMKLHHQLNQ